MVDDSISYATSGPSKPKRPSTPSDTHHSSGISDISKGNHETASNGPGVAGSQTIPTELTDSEHEDILMVVQTQQAIDVNQDIQQIGSWTAVAHVSSESVTSPQSSPLHSRNSSSMSLVGLSYEST
ncbi:hypothetical protein BGW36DRAFT_433878 [Talaromyces proteolyticus]|uniref:Uncharacterized protein n=1 Tax=Talaromyces proteolyticus TaxID=1131652 RepID=A0AAD4KEG5_9EURO|nr:uncharacterized protein BGW36DRAFT_433878 [Talaromyces proteolyticus]KAH8689115.1 hypothetical protein BGW36DRAFT_433878 [Talaromyces proteolyticus]